MPIEQDRIQAVAFERVTVIKRGKVILLDIATNPLLDDQNERRSGGVDPASLEAKTASAALAYRLQYELTERMDLPDWLQREVNKRGGRGGGAKQQGTSKLAAELLGYDLSDRKTWSEEKVKKLKAEIRKIEEYLQPAGVYKGKLFVYGKYKLPSAERRARFANLPGGEQGNPFAPAIALWSGVLDKTTLRAAAKGDWQISEDSLTFATKRTDDEGPKDRPEPLHRYVRLTEETLPQLVEELVNFYIGEVDADLTELVWLYSLSLEAIKG